MDPVGREVPHHREETLVGRAPREAFVERGQARLVIGPDRPDAERLPILERHVTLERRRVIQGRHHSCSVPVDLVEHHTLHHSKIDALRHS